MKRPHRSVSCTCIFRTAFILYCISIFTTLIQPGSAAAQTPDNIVDISIACSNDRVYTWYLNGSVTVGSSSRLDSHQPHLPATTYALPAGKTREAVVGFGIAGNDHVYAWYDDGTVSSGTSTRLDQYRVPYAYSLPPGKSAADIVGMAIACSNDHVYVWYNDGTVSSGTSDDLDKYRSLYNYVAASGKSPADIVGLGIAGNDHVYAWYRDRTASSGTTDDLDRYRTSYSYTIVTPACDFAANNPTFNEADRVINALGARGSACDSSVTMKVTLKRYNRWWFDKTLADSSGSGTNFEVRVQHQCTGTGSHMIYTEVTVGGKSKQSQNVGVAFCD